MTGQQTDTAKAHAYAMLNQAQSPEAMRAVLDNLRFEIRNLQNVSRTHRGLDPLPNNFGAQGGPASDRPARFTFRAMRTTDGCRREQPTSRLTAKRGRNADGLAG